eukprot:CAMPEP_0171933660 /NCGR_PEP_ID=MMETSP0993-20121228/31413_1 /TAXON_ID=483369 /ORGANISM="non described non described, Strain CCMP2098" /LENGTH=279 /DNA_ID=CAMNT_0012574215 /DNA_START=32 /DNA_END=868 /DNA_ORIENTATION=+
MASSQNKYYSCGGCAREQAATISCCGERLCTTCFYFSPHVRHTPAYTVQRQQLPSSRVASTHSAAPRARAPAVCLAVKRCRDDISSVVQPLWEATWQELARDIASETGSLARRKSSCAVQDPLGDLLSSDDRHGLGAESSAESILASASAPNIPVPSSSSSSPPQPSVPKKRRASAKAVDLLKRDVSRPHDMWNHSGVIPPKRVSATARTSTSSNGDIVLVDDDDDGSLLLGSRRSGLPCPMCNSSGTLRKTDDDGERSGRKGEIWGSSIGGDRVSLAC